MSAIIQLKFGDLVLDYTNDITISRINEKSSKPISSTSIPLADGAIAESARIGPKTITVEGDIIGSDYDDLRANLDALHAGLLNGLQKLTKDNERYIYCQLKDFSYAYDHLTRRATWSAQFLAHYPFWLSEEAETDTRAPATATPYSIYHSGNAPARVKVEVTADGQIEDAFKLTNNTNGKVFQYRGTIAAAEMLEIDNRYDGDDFEVLNNGVSDIENFEGDFMELAAGSNELDPIWESTDESAPTVTITWRNCWY